MEEAKVLGYLLAVDHPVGGGKAANFLAAGYVREDWQRLQADLVQIGRNGEIAARVETQFGVKVVIDGAVNSPSGASIALRTVWISDNSDAVLRLVTAYPR
ncbi:adhesin [Skermania sp. ID1734]|uniref:DUF6883 domain-containing protein n=1 Tax=Skermania sp. ID1734 TaxID=2597516 RepID=UPI00117C037F|nr:DUF6883 domain-containing protein [Skermania sp. ID1734]TSD99958.1 adhesin [Skermania sp. ID1734]